MLLMNAERRYGAVAKSLHWIATALFIALFVLGWTMTELPLGAEKFERYNLHKSVGVTVLLLMACRLLWRALTPPPPLPDDMSASMRSMAKLGHAALYFMVFVQVGVGLVHSWSANFPVIVFGQFTLPSLTEPNEPLKELLGAVHYWGGWTLLLLIAGHVGAALYHHFIRKDSVLKRMLPWGHVR